MYSWGINDRETVNPSIDQSIKISERVKEHLFGLFGHGFCLEGKYDPLSFCPVSERLPVDFPGRSSARPLLFLVGLESSLVKQNRPFRVPQLKKHSGFVNSFGIARFFIRDRVQRVGYVFFFSNPGIFTQVSPAPDSSANL